MCVAEAEHPTGELRKRQIIARSRRLRVEADEARRLRIELSVAADRQSATAEILNVIARSRTDAQPVFDVISESARRLLSGQTALVTRLTGDMLHLAACTAGSQAGDDEIRNSFPARLDAPGIHSRVARTSTIAIRSNVDMDPDVPHGVKQMARARGYRSIVVIPLIRDGAAIGTIGVSSAAPKAFHADQIGILKTFADQAVIAIENARLFEAVQARTSELDKSLDDLRAAQDRLIQIEKLSSLGQLTAGIAHEIKNPLNFINNFAALSVELTDELMDMLKPLPLAAEVRNEIEALSELVQANLRKILEHGWRADSIVKNMLLHSRGGGSELRATNVNTLVEESLHLAYHGIRAEKPDFHADLKRDLDADIGMVDLFPQEISRVLLNLLSNGFYAIEARRSQLGSTFEPMVITTTRNCGDHVEIRIRDNGIGIPADVKDSIFNPFFTTKPPGEGTGLGLSISHDIVVKQHGGRLDVDTHPGEYTEFTIRLNRSEASQDGSKGKL